MEYNGAELNSPRHSGWGHVTLPRHLMVFGATFRLSHGRVLL